MNLTGIVKPSLQLLPSLTRNLCRSIVSWTRHPGQWNATAPNSLLNQFCGMSKPMCNTNISLIPNSINATPSCGMRLRGKLTLRCKDCYYFRGANRLYVFCDTHPRHKQMGMVTKKKYTWMLSHACMSKERPY